MNYFKIISTNKETYIESKKDMDAIVKELSKSAFLPIMKKDREHPTYINTTKIDSFYEVNARAIGTSDAQVNERVYVLYSEVK